MAEQKLPFRAQLGIVVVPRFSRKNKEHICRLSSRPLRISAVSQDQIESAGPFSGRLFKMQNEEQTEPPGDCTIAPTKYLVRDPD